MPKKHSIIKTATHLFATQGFDGTTTIGLSKEAGVTEPLLYYHFTGKDEIYTSILTWVFEDYFSRLKTIQGKKYAIRKDRESLQTALPAYR